jgi:hypothetical protein
MHYPLRFMARAFLAAAFVCALPAIAADPKQSAEDTYFDAYPTVPYPHEAQQKRISGIVIALIFIKDGQIADVTATGPDLLVSASIKWIKTRWKPKAGVTETIRAPIEFGIAHGVPLAAGKSGETDVFLARPVPPYPSGTNERGIVEVLIVVKDGKITQVKAQVGPESLANPAVKWIKEKWLPKPHANGSFLLPLLFKPPPPKPAASPAAPSSPGIVI